MFFFILLSLIIILSIFSWILGNDIGFKNLKSYKFLESKLKILIEKNMVFFIVIIFIFFFLFFCIFILSLRLLVLWLGIV